MGAVIYNTNNRFKTIDTVDTLPNIILTDVWGFTDFLCKIGVIDCYYGVSIPSVLLDGIKNDSILKSRQIIHRITAKVAYTDNTICDFK